MKALNLGCSRLLAGLLALCAFQRADAGGYCGPKPGSTLTSEKLMDYPVDRVVGGKPTYVCIGFNGSDSGFADKMAFVPTADAFTRINVTGSYQKFMAKSTQRPSSFNNTFLYVQSFNVSSYYKIFIDRNANSFTDLTAVINVKDGIVQSITWDEGCLFCVEGTPQCSVSTYLEPQRGYDLKTLGLDSQFGNGKSCLTPVDQCTTNGKPNVLCDLRLYVTWTGTDADGRYLVSAANRFSQFRAYSISSYYDQAINIFKTEIIDISDAIAGGTSAPTPAPTASNPVVNGTSNSTL